MDPLAPFLRPWLLWGLVAVALPILIHLLGRRRVRTVPIATLRFLERASARAAARWKLRRLLLLLARAAAIACLALLFAGPGCRDEGASAGPAQWVLLLDTSPSMASVAGRESCLDRAKARLMSLVDAAGPSDRFLFATTRAGEEPRWRRGFSADTSSVRRELRDARVEFGDHRTDRAVERALRLLEGVDGGRVALATDLQASAWPPGRVPGVGTVPITVLDAGLPAPKNAWVASVEEAEGGLAARLGRMGPGDEGARRTVRLRLSDGQAATAFVGGGEAAFQVRTPGSSYSGSVHVEPGGDLPLDDELAFTAQEHSAARILLVDGDPREFLIRDELFFVRRALAPGGKLGRTFRTREVKASDLGPRDLEGVDAFFLANPGPLSGPVVAALHARVEAGAGLVVTSGDRWGRADAGPMTALLPAPLRDVVYLAPQAASRRPYELVDGELLQGPMALFRTRAAGDLTATRVWTYRVLESKPARASTVLLRLENGAPLLLERTLGKGRSLFLATTVDRDGSDLCLQAAFIPWLERLLLYAAGRLEPRAPSPGVAGRPTALPY
ncbi:MAG: BatA domain-containing protein, partial [Deltaproteobacteria bacterium]|nr:BatA domain-containing protein [Deltaproteobacteria bacterium]